MFFSSRFFASPNVRRVAEIRFRSVDTVVDYASFSDLTSRQRANYRANKCRFWNADLPQRIEEQRQKDAEQSKPAPPPPGRPPYTQQQVVTAVAREPQPPQPPSSWIDREPVFSLPTPPDDPTLTRPGGEYPDEPNAGEEPSAEPSDDNPGGGGGGGDRGGAAESPAEAASAQSSSVVVSLVIIVGILFLLVNVCAFGGIYYQRDKLRVRERLFNNRFRCDVGNASRTYDDDDAGDGDDEDDVYVKRVVRPPEAAAAAARRAYDPVAMVASVKPEAIGGKRLGKWAEISRQRSSSSVTVDPHTRVKEWINTEIIQRYSPRILRRHRREEKKRQLVCAEDPAAVAAAAAEAAATADSAVAPAADPRAEKSRNKVRNKVCARGEQVDAPRVFKNLLSIHSALVSADLF